MSEQQTMDARDQRISRDLAGLISDDGQWVIRPLSRTAYEQRAAVAGVPAYTEAQVTASKRVVLQDAKSVGYQLLPVLYRFGANDPDGARTVGRALVAARILGQIGEQAGDPPSEAELIRRENRWDE